MPTFDNHANFSYSTVATAPSPATSGTTLSVATGDGANFPTPPFNCVVWPASDPLPLNSNAEIIRVTAMSGDDMTTIVRAQESTTAKSIVNGYQIMAAITKKTLTDIEGAIGGGSGGSNYIFASSGGNLDYQTSPVAGVFGGAIQFATIGTDNGLITAASLTGAGEISVTFSQTVAINMQAEPLISNNQGAIPVTGLTSTDLLQWKTGIYLNEGGGAGQLIVGHSQILLAGTSVTSIPYSQWGPHYLGATGIFILEAGTYIFGVDLSIYDITTDSEVINLSAGSAPQVTFIITVSGVS